MTCKLTANKKTNKTTNFVTRKTVLVSISKKLASVSLWILTLLWLNSYLVLTFTYLYIFHTSSFASEEKKKKLSHLLSPKILTHTHRVKNCLSLSTKLFNIKFERFELEWPSISRVSTQRIHWLIPLDFYLPAIFNPTSIPSPRVYFKSLRLNTQKYNHFISKIFIVLSISLTTQKSLFIL